MLKLRPGPAEPETGTAPEASDASVRAARAKFLRRQRARRWLVWRRILLAVAGIALLAGLVWLFFFSTVLAVKGAEVQGVDVLEPDEVESVAEVPHGVPLATVDLTAIEARVESLPAVQSAEASRAWPDQVRIEVTEREAVAVVSWEGQWRGLDGNGILFRTFDEEPVELPHVTMSSTTPVEALAEAATIVQVLPPAILDRVDHVEVQSIDRITLVLTGGSTVTWGSADESEDKAAVLEVLLEQEARVYDVTAPGRPTLKK